MREVSNKEMQERFPRLGELADKQTLSVLASYEDGQIVYRLFRRTPGQPWWEELGPLTADEMERELQAAIDEYTRTLYSRNTDTMMTESEKNRINAWLLNSYLDATEQFHALRARIKGPETFLRGAQ